jgi:hypothetical protein
MSMRRSPIAARKSLAKAVRTIQDVNLYVLRPPEARDAIGAEAFAAAEARGAAMSYEEAMADAREWLATVPTTAGSPRPMSVPG